MRAFWAFCNDLLRHRFRRTTLISIACLSFFIGIVVAEQASLSWTWLLLGLFFIPVILKKDIVSVLTLVFLFATFGQLWGMRAISNEEPLHDLIGQKVTIRAVVTDDSYYGAKKQLTFLVRTNEIVSPRRAEVNAPLRVSTYTLTGAVRGDVVELKGKLTSSVGNVAAAMYYANATITGRQATFLNGIRRNFEAGLHNALPEPQASFAAGLLIGQRSALSTVWQDILRDAGLTHIIAVSGYNLTILVAFSRRLLKRGSRYQIMMVSTMLVGSFVIITGLSPSILRAIIVTSLLQLGWFYGRRFNPITLIALAIAISAAIDPFQVWRSVGWYLSFAAFFGIIVIAPLLTRSGKPTLSTDTTGEANAFTGLLAESFAAQAMTIPIIALIFGQISAVGLIANIIVAPLIPLAMLLSFIAGLAGWFVPAISGWLAWPANVLLTAILDVAHTVSEMPGARVSVTINAARLVVLYAAIVALVVTTAILRRQRRPLSMLESEEQLGVV